MHVRTISHIFGLLISLVTLTCPVLSIDQLPPQPLLSGLNISIVAPATGFPSSPQSIAFYREISLPPYSRSTITIDFGARPSSSSPATVVAATFAIVQLHACFHTLGLSYNASLVAGQHQIGTNLGLIVRPTARHRLHTIYAHNANFHTAVNASLALIAYAPNAPQPGACSLELSMADVPTLQVHDANDAAAAGSFVAVDTPLAADSAGKCATPLPYTFYHRYLPRGDFTCRTYFDGIRAMLTVDAIRSNGSLGATHPYKPQRRTYATVPGAGVIFATIVRSARIGGGSSGDDDDEDEDTEQLAAAAYVPAYTAFCAPIYWHTDCDIFAGAPFKLLVAVLIAVGIVRAYLSPLLPMLGMLIDGFVVGAILMFLFLAHCWPDRAVSPAAETAIICIGAAGLAAALATCACLGGSAVQWLTASVTHIVVGCMLAAFTTDALDTADMKSTSWWYQFVFVACVLAVLVMTPCYTRWGLVLMSATWGTYALVQAVAVLNNSLHGTFVVVNVWRTLQVPEFRYANSSLAYESDDAWLFGLWLGLLLSAIWTQVWLIGRQQRRQQQLIEDETMNERTPIVTRWTDGSDDVFESPESNYRFFSRLRHVRE